MNARALESFLGSLSLSLSGKMNSLFSHVLWTHPASCYHDEKKSHLVIFTSILFFDFSLFSFRWVRVLSCVCQRRQAQDSAKPANAHFNDSWTLSQSATSEKPFSAKDDKRESFKHKSNASKTPRSLRCWCHFNIDFSLIEKSMRVLNMWLMVVQVYAIAHIAVNVGYQILILLMKSFPHFLSFCNAWMCECLCSCVD